MSHDNRQVAHLWAAHNTGATGKDRARSSNGNFHFSGASLYSYRTEIARFMTAPNGARYAMLNVHRYSITTSSKHQPAARMALHGLPIDRVIAYDGEVSSAPIETVVRHLVQAAGVHLETAKRARKEWSKEASERYAKECEDDARWLANAYGLKLADNIADALDAIAREREGVATWSALARFFGEYWQAAETMFDRPLRAIAEIAAGSAWLRGTDDLEEVRLIRRHLPYDGPTLLRVAGDIVKTSRGAEFPLEHGLRALPLIEAVAANGGRNFGDAGPRLGHFRIDRIEADGTVVAGCHRVPLFAIQHAARQVG